MSPASPSIPSDSRLKWRKRKRESHLNGQPKPQEEEEEEEEEEEDEPAPVEVDEENGRDSRVAGRAAGDPVLDLREAEVLSDGGLRISDFPAAVRRGVNRPHPSVLALVAAAADDDRSHPTGCTPPFLENISHGQLQALPTVIPDHPSLQTPSELERPSAYVCTPPPLMEGRGVAKRHPSGQLLLVPMHSEWFSPSTVHRLERQMLPHFFSGKSAEHTPEKYIALRNRIIAKYMENPGRRLTVAEFYVFVSGGANNELYDLSRILRFLDNWGIINYLAATSVHTRLRLAGSLLREDANGELMVQTMPLKSIDGLILFDRPKCSIRPEDIPLLSSSSAYASEDCGAGFDDLDASIRERLSEHSCSYCSMSLPSTHYQSQKEADIILCMDCYHSAKFIVGHSSLDFLRVDSKKDTSDLDGDNWTDQETLLLLEALEKYNNNWNEIAEHVGTKSKAQCILHFIRLPMEDGLLENIEIPHMAVSSDISNGHNNELSSSNSNGDAAGVCLQDSNSRNQLPFANSVNPVMSLIAFLASAIGPRVAATCASASLSILTKGDSRSSSENMQGSYSKFCHQKVETFEDQVPYVIKDTPPLDPERIKYAAKCGLSAAVMKAKLFADQEEREIQRLAATIINNQLKRLELKLKQFAEVETLLMKECEQVERTRQRLSAERVRMISGRLGPTGTTQPTVSGAAAAAAAATTSSNTTLSVMPASVGQVNMQQPYGDSLATHPQMSFRQRQQQMFALGPRLPLSAINPSASAPSQNIMFHSGLANTSTPNHHPLLRPPAGSNTNVG